jgi:hypothetical protein
MLWTTIVDWTVGARVYRFVPERTPAPEATGSLHKTSTPTASIDTPGVRHAKRCIYASFIAACPAFCSRFRGKMQRPSVAPRQRQIGPCICC